jgi:hypothetical protein
MSRADLAEALLLLVSDQEHAATIVGDLLEENDSAHFIRFWWSVLRTAVSQLCRQIAQAPLRIAGPAVRGMVVEFGYLLVAAFLMMILLWAAISVARVTFHAELPDSIIPPLGFLLTNLLVPFRLGTWLSKRYPGREAITALTLAVLYAVINLCAGLICSQIARTGGEAHVDITIFVRLIAWDGDIHHALVAAFYYLTLYQLQIQIR